MSRPEKFPYLVSRFGTSKTMKVPEGLVPTITAFLRHLDHDKCSGTPFDYTEWLNVPIDKISDSKGFILVKTAHEIMIGDILGFIDNIKDNTYHWYVKVIDIDENKGVFSFIGHDDYLDVSPRLDLTWTEIYENLITTERKLYKITYNFGSYQEIKEKIDCNLELAKKLEEATKKERKLQPMTKLNGLTLFRLIAFKDSDNPITMYFTVTGNGNFKDLISLTLSKDDDYIEIPKCHPFYDRYLQQAEDRTKKPC